LPSSVLLGKAEPRLHTPELRELTPDTSRGFEAIAFAEDVLGFVLHPWQKWMLIHGLELLADGTFRFRTLLVLVARQNGKTTLVQVLALWRMYVDAAPLVIGTAQNLDLAEECWQGAVEIAEGTPELASEIEEVCRVNGKRHLRLVTGERYKVATASRRGGRGLSGDMIVLDELREHQNWEAWGAITKTTMARARAQTWGLSNAGDRTSVVLWTLRARALAYVEGKGNDDDDGSLGVFDWSAPEGCDMRDPDGHAQANPSLNHPHGITDAAIRAALATDPEHVFRTEVLCQWVDQAVDPVLPAAAWTALNVGIQPMTAPALSVEVALDRATATIGAAWTVGGRSHVEVVEDHPGTGWVVLRCKELTARYGGGPLVIDVGTEAAGLVPAAEAAGLDVLKVNTAARVAACGAFYDAAVVGSLSHNGDPAIGTALAGARWKDVGDGARVFTRRGSAADIAALYAVVLALHGLANPTAREADFFLI